MDSFHEEHRAVVNATLQNEIQNLRHLSVKALKARYRELFGEDCASANRAHLLRRVGWRLQAIAEGDMSERARARAAELAAFVDLRLRPTRRFCRQLDGEPAAPMPIPDKRDR